MPTPRCEQRGSPNSGITSPAFPKAGVALETAREGANGPWPLADASAILNEMAAPSGRRIEVGDTTLVWGNATQWKAALREEAQHRHLDLPVGERLMRALELVLPRDSGRDKPPQ